MPTHTAMRQFLRAVISVCIATSSVALAKQPDALVCPAVMASRIDKSAHSDWAIYSNSPLRLSGADIQFVVDGHLEATLDADEDIRLNDDALSKASIYRLSVHRDAQPFTLVCHYGVHAQLSRNLPRSAQECKVIKHGRFTKIEFEASCR